MPTRYGNQGLIALGCTAERDRSTTTPRCARRWTLRASAGHGLQRFQYAAQARHELAYCPTSRDGVLWRRRWSITP